MLCKHSKNYFQLISSISDIEVRPYLSVTLIRKINVQSRSKRKIESWDFSCIKSCISEISQDLTGAVILFVNNGVGKIPKST